MWNTRPTGRGAYLPERTRDGQPVIPGNVPDLMPGPENTYQSYGYGWANASNTPFRLYKQHDHEGGITVPLIAKWPAAIQQPGTLTDELAHVIDLMPTFLDAAGADQPSEFEGHAVHPMDGKSLLPILQGSTREPAGGAVLAVGVEGAPSGRGGGSWWRSGTDLGSCTTSNPTEPNCTI